MRSIESAQRRTCRFQWQQIPDLLPERLYKLCVQNARLRRIGRFNCEGMRRKKPKILDESRIIIIIIIVTHYPFTTFLLYFFRLNRSVDIFRSLVSILIRLQFKLNLQ